MLTAQLTVLAAPPVLALAGMLNNLETLAWVPWMVLAARGSPRVRVLLLPLAMAGGWLTGAPVLWAFGVAAAAVGAPRDRWTLAGTGLGVLLVAAQLLPFAGWVVQGDRGPAALRDAMTAGALPLSGLASFLVPGAGASGWIETLFLGGPLVAAGLAFLRRRPLVLSGVVLCLGLAVSPAVDGGNLYLLLTGGLVRYPSRFAAMAAFLLAAAGILGLGNWLGGGDRAWTAAVAVLTVLGSPAAPAAGAVAGAVLASLLLAAAAWPSRRGLRAAALGLSAVTALPLLHAMLEPREAGLLERMSPPWHEARGTGRLFSPIPGPRSRRLLTASPELQAVWPAGYTNLTAGVALVRSDGPLEQRVVSALERRAQSPRGMWWLNASGARWVVLAHRTRVEGLEPVRAVHGFWLHRNPRAWPLVLMVSRIPSVGEPPRVVPGLVTVAWRADGVTIRSLCRRPAEMVLSLAPLRGWRWTLDGRPAMAHRGPSVLQGLEIDPGAHRLEGRFRPALLGPGLAGSLLGLAALLTFTVWFHRREGDA